MKASSKRKAKAGVKHPKPHKQYKLKSGRKVTLPQLRDIFEHMK